MGCSSSEQPSTGSEGAVTPPHAAPPQNAVTLSGQAEPGAIGLFADHGSIHVGDSWEQARQVFPQPSRDAYDIHDLPASLPREFEAKGWESPSGEGFGVLVSNSKVVCAMYQLERTHEDVIDEFVRLESAGMVGIRPDKQTGKQLRYWFWRDPATHETAMLLAQQNKTGMNVTVAMGDDNVLKAIDVSPEAAKEQISILGGAPTGEGGSG